MAKKKKIFSRTRLALLLGFCVIILLAFIIRLLPERAGPGNQAVAAQKSLEGKTVTEPQADGKKEPLAMSAHRPVNTASDAVAQKRTPASPVKLSGTVSPAADPVQTAAKAVRQETKQKYLLVVVIDDVGQNLQELEPLLQLPVPLTFSVLPHLPFSREAVKRIRAAGKEAILHMPMEPVGEANPGPGALYCSYSNAQLVELLDAAFSAVPDVRGFNNHMGSRVTANIETMRVILRYAAAKGLFFLDSKTTNLSVAPELAREYHVPLLERAVFLDNEPEADAIMLQLTKTLEIVVKAAGPESAKPVIAIGHVQSHELAPVLRQMLASFKEAGVGFSRLDEFCN